MEKSTLGDGGKKCRMVAQRVGLARARAEFRFVWEEVTGPPEQRAAAAGILPQFALQSIATFSVTHSESFYPFLSCVTRCSLLAN